MNESTQIMMVVIGVLLTALVTMLLAQVTAMRSDLKAYIAKQDDINNRLTVLETEHRGATCRFREES